MKASWLGRVFLWHFGHIRNQSVDKHERGSQCRYLRT